MNFNSSLLLFFGTFAGYIKARWCITIFRIPMHSTAQHSKSFRSQTQPSFWIFINELGWGSSTLFALFSVSLFFFFSFKNELPLMFQSLFFSFFVTYEWTFFSKNIILFKKKENKIVGKFRAKEAKKNTHTNWFHYY